MRKKNERLAITVVAALLGGFGQSLAYAQSAGQIAEMEAKFAAADKDGDGKLTPEEAKAGMPRVSKNFSKIDSGGKGFVTVEDIKAAMASMAK